MENFLFRRIYPADVDNLRQLCNQLFPIQYPDSWYDFVTSGHLRTVAIFHEGVMIAVIICELKKRFQIQKEDESILSWTFGHDASVGYILSLGVSEAYRGLGLGTLLLNHQLELFNRDKCFVVYLHVLSTNLTARRFYEKRQFTKHLTMPYYYTIGGVPADGISYARYMNNGYRKLPLPIIWLRHCLMFLLFISKPIKVLFKKLFLSCFKRRRLNVGHTEIL